MVSGGAGFIGVFGRIVRPRRALRAAFVRKVSRIFQVVATRGHGRRSHRSSAPPKKLQIVIY